MASKASYRKHCEKVKAKNKAYRQAHAEELHAYELKRSPIRIALQRKKRQADPEYRRKVNEEVRSRRIAARLALIEKLGGKCVRCGFDDWRGLQIDHVKGGGTKELLRLGAGKVYRLALENKDGHYQLLCANCNQIKRYEEGQHNWLGGRIRIADPAC
jgi:hypothetical protein